MNNEDDALSLQGFLNEASHRVRGFLLDSQLPDPHELASLVGCSSLSPELAYHEEKESDKRVKQVIHLMPLITAQAKALADSTINYQRAHTSKVENLPEGLWDESKRMIASVATSAILGSLSQFNDMKFLTVHTTPKKGKK